MRPATLLVLVAAVTGCTSGNRTPPPAAPPTPIPEAAIGLAPGPATEQPPQAPIPFNSAGPGESTAPPRPNDEFPPVVPHSLDGLEPITSDYNACLDCHLGEMAADMGATPIPTSHFVDLRRAPDDTADEPDAARFNCTACHVPQTDAPPLVANPA